MATSTVSDIQVSSEPPTDHQNVFLREERSSLIPPGYQLATIKDLQDHLEKEGHPRKDLVKVITTASRQMRLKDGWVDSWDPSLTRESGDLSKFVRTFKGFKQCIPDKLLILSSEAGEPFRDLEAEKAALLYACEDACEDLKGIKKMLESKGVLEPAQDGGITALHVAAFKGHRELWNVLTKTWDENIQSSAALGMKYGKAIIHYAVEGKDDAFFQAVLEWYVNEGGAVAATDEAGATALHMAARMGSKEKVEALLKHLKPEHIRECVDNLGETPLHEAVRAGHLEVVKTLLQTNWLYLERDHDRLKELLKRSSESDWRYRCDSDGRTALHWAVQLQDSKKAEAMVDVLLEACPSEEEKVLLVCSEAGGVGTAEDCAEPNSDVQRKLSMIRKKQAEEGRETLLQMAVRLEKFTIAKEMLLNARARLTELDDKTWRKKHNIPKEYTSSEIRRTLFEGRLSGRDSDQPASEDYLGRGSLAEGIAALLMNPHTGTPVTIGICGGWGMGKSSLMLQVETLVWRIAVELNLRELKRSEEGLRSRETISSVQEASMSPLGALLSQPLKEIWVAVEEVHERSQKRMSSVEGALFIQQLKKMERIWGAFEEGDLRLIRREELKQLALANQSRMMLPRDSDNIQIPAVLTVHYNAWHYRSETEAWAGLAVKIIEEMEATMSMAQRWDLYWRYSWRKEKPAIYLRVFLPILLTVILSSSISWVAWKLFPLANNTIIRSMKFVVLPISVLVTTWGTMQRIFHVIKPVSEQLLSYVHLPDHRGKLGYQQDVIEDIQFVKQQLSRRPDWGWVTLCRLWMFIPWLIRTVFGWLWELPGVTYELLVRSPYPSSATFSFPFIYNIPRNVVVCLFLIDYVKNYLISTLITFLGFLPIFLIWRNLWKPLIPSDYINGTRIHKLTPPKGDGLRIVVFVDDLDRCSHKVILQVLSAINLVLAACEINVVIGIDKSMIELAIMTEFGNNDAPNNSELQVKATESMQRKAERYLSKIIQLPVELPDPNQNEFTDFLSKIMGAELPEKAPPPGPINEEGSSPLLPQEDQEVSLLGGAQESQGSLHHTVSFDKVEDSIKVEAPRQEQDGDELEKERKKEREPNVEVQEEDGIKVETSQQG